MKRKRILQLILAAAMTLTLVACQNENSSVAETQSDSVITQQMTETITADETFEVTEVKTIEPPEDGWTLEELNEVLYINGQPIDLPLMFSSLEEGYEIQDIVYYDDSSRGSGILYYCNQFVAIITFYELKNDYKINSLSFTPSYYEENQIYSNYISINGFGLDCNTLDLPKYLGDKFSKRGGFIEYVLADERYTIIFTDIEKEYMIRIFEGVNKND